MFWMILKMYIKFQQFIGSNQATTTPEFKNSNYNIAYTYFKLKEYDSSGWLFSKANRKSTAW